MEAITRFVIPVLFGATVAWTLSLLAYRLGRRRGSPPPTLGSPRAALHFGLAFGPGMGVAEWAEQLLSGRPVSWKDVLFLACVGAVGPLVVFAVSNLFHVDSRAPDDF